MKTVLIVEDTDIQRNMLHYGLREHFRVLTAIDAKEALDKIITFQPHAVVLDVQLPGELDGIQLCELVKANRSLRDTHILLATGDVDAALDNLGGDQTLRADDLVLKPYSISDIVSKINKALPFVK